MKQIAQPKIGEILAAVSELLIATKNNFHQFGGYVGFQFFSPSGSLSTLLRIVIDMPADENVVTTEAVAKILYDNGVSNSLDYPEPEATPLKYECGCIASNGVRRTRSEVWENFPALCPTHEKPVHYEVGHRLSVTRSVLTVYR